MTLRRLPHRFVVYIVTLSLTGCATAVPYVGQGPHPQFERGRPCPPVDFLGNVLTLPYKILLLSWRFGNHSIPADVERVWVEYVDSHQPLMGDTKVRLNQYAPIKDFKRLTKNKKVAWPYRVIFGVLTGLFELLLPGRLFGSDYYNPWTDTVHIYSGHSAIGLHELGHAHDFSSRRYKGSYAFARLIPFVDLYQEWEATDTAIDYLIDTKQQDLEIDAYKILYPAYGTYMGSYLPFFGSIIGLVVGHVWGRTTAASKARLYRQNRVIMVTPTIATSQPATVTPPAATQGQPALATP